MSRFASEVHERLSQVKVVAVLMIDDVEAAVPLARSLAAGGVTAMELTLRTPVALEALVAIRRDVPEMLAGIGTVLTVDQVKEVAQADAAFAVSPGTNADVIKAAQDHGLAFAPGVMTPSDIEEALSLDCRLLKFFPAEPSGGLSYLRSVAAPFKHLGVEFLPLGGINLQNLEAYLTEPTVLAVGGSWLAPRNLVAAQEWAKIETLASEASAIVRQLNSSKA